MFRKVLFYLGFRVSLSISLSDSLHTDSRLNMFMYSLYVLFDLGRRVSTLLAPCILQFYLGNHTRCLRHFSPSIYALYVTSK